MLLQEDCELSLKSFHLHRFLLGFPQDHEMKIEFLKKSKLWLEIYIITQWRKLGNARMSSLIFGNVHEHYCSIHIVCSSNQKQQHTD